MGALRCLGLRFRGSECLRLVEGVKLTSQHRASCLQLFSGIVFESVLPVTHLSTRCDGGLVEVRLSTRFRGVGLWALGCQACFDLIVFFQDLAAGRLRPGFQSGRANTDPKPKPLQCRSLMNLSS